MIELEHSPLGGSAAHRFLACRYSFLKQREEIEAGTFIDVPSEFAALGTAAHELGAQCLETGTEPFQWLNMDFNGYKAGWEDGISLDAVQIYVNECSAILDKVRSRPHEIYIERTIKRPEIHPLFKGTVDFGVVTPTAVYLRDYKNGEGIGVEAPNNRQLLYYGALLIIQAGYIEDEHRDIPVDLGIVQPNFFGMYEDVIPWVTTVGYMLDWLNDVLLPEMHELYSRKAPPTDADAVPGDHCQFCPVLLLCPKMQAAFRNYADANEDFVTMLSDKELDELYAQREYARRFMNVLEQTVKARKLTGADIKSAKLVEPQVARVWAPGGLAAIEAAFGDKAYAPRKPLSPAGIEKLSSRGKELALTYGYKPDSAGLTVAPLSDRRPEAKPRGNVGVYAEHARQAMEDF